MAGQPGSTPSALPAAAQVVGNAFVNQYYNVLHQSPSVVHRFYTDASRLTRAEAGADGAVDTVVSQSEIHQKVMALDYGDFKAEIITVDSQDSLSGGVLVMVTGSLSRQLSGKRNFVQSFFLAPQEKGYFVLNDVFRYLDEVPEVSNQVPILPNGIPDPPQVQVVSEPELSSHDEQEVRELSSRSMPGVVETTVEESFVSLEHVDVAEAQDGELEDLTGTVAAPVLDEPLSPVAAPSVPVPSLEETSEEVPKKSYASIVSYASILRMKENAGGPPLNPTYDTAPKASVPSTERPAPYAPGPAVTTASHESLDEGSPFENEADGRSVYVKNLPMNISASHLEEEFAKFGVVKPGGVNVKSQKQGACYAFVEFEEITSAQAAIESSPISIGTQKVFIEAKRPMGPRSGSRGGHPPGAGRGDRQTRNDGVRGRVPYTGRGLGGRAPGQDGPGRGRGSGSGPARSGSGNFGEGSTNNGGGDSYRRDAPGGNGNRGPRRGGNQNPRNGAVSRGTAPVTAI